MQIQTWFELARQTGAGLSPEVLAGAAATVVALALAYFPRLNTLYAALPKETKGLIALGLMAAVALGVFAQACTNVHLLPWSTTCDQTGVETLVRTFFLAVSVNQGLFLMLPQTAAVKAARA